MAEEESGEGGGFAAKTDAIKKSLIQSTTKRRSVPAAALGLLRRKDLHLHNFFQRNSTKNNNNNFSNNTTTKEIILNCRPMPRETCCHTNSPKSTCFSNCVTGATTSNQSKIHQQLIDGGKNMFKSNSEDTAQETFPLAAPQSGPRFVRNRLTTTPLNYNSSLGKNMTTVTGQMPVSSSTHHHLATGGGHLHARRESFLYRADDREPLFNPSSLLGYRPVSRASSVASSDPQ